MTNILYLHIFCAFLSLLLLIIRGVMQLNNYNWRVIKPLRILPHLTDTLLLISGFIVAFGVGYGFPWWIIAKLLLLIVYVFFSVKFFSKNVISANKLYFIAALTAFSGIMLIAYLYK